MKKKNLPRIVAIVITLWITATAYAQHNFKYKALIDTVVESRFYKINLSPAIVAKCKRDVEDIRILDEEGKQVPYITKQDLPAFTKQNFTELPIIKKEKGKDKLTHIFIENTTNKDINYLLLFVTNTDAKRTFSLSGGADTTDWSIIKENMHLENAFANDSDHVVYTLSIPRSPFHFLQLTISGENVLPFNVIKAGIYKDEIVYGKYTELPQPMLQQKDSIDGYSQIHMQFDDNYRINLIVINIEGTKYYRRRFTMSERGFYADNDWYEFSGFLNSATPNSYEANFKNKNLYLTIFNEDNPPLKIKEVHAFQLNTSLLTYLQSGKKYHIAFGDSSIEAPVYDLKFFRDSAENNPAEITLKDIVVNNIAAAKPIAKPGNHTLLLWIAIIAVLIILCFFTFKILSEVNKKPAGDP